MGPHICASHFRGSKGVCLVLVMPVLASRMLSQVTWLLGA